MVVKTGMVILLDDLYVHMLLYVYVYLYEVF